MVQRYGSASVSPGHLSAWSPPWWTVVAIPCAIFYNNLAAKVRQLSTDMDGFATNYGRIAVSSREDD
jgi:hypothetical protein